MSKVYKGDYVYHLRSEQNGYVVADRGGYVGRWQVRLDNGSTHYASSRDLIILNPIDNRPRVYNSRLSTAEKLDLLLEHLGLSIEAEPRVIEVKREKSSN